MLIYNDETSIKKTIYAMLKVITGYKNNQQIIAANQGAVHGSSDFVTYSFKIKDSALSFLRSKENKQSQYNAFLVDVIVNCYNNKFIANKIRTAHQYLNISSFNILHLGKGNEINDLSYIEQGVYGNRHQTSMPIHIYISQSTTVSGKTLELGEFNIQSGGN